MDLWAEWERRATNLADPARGETARRFYEANRAAMDAGAAVYWPGRWPLVALMGRRAEIGAAAFDTEYQGVPSVEGLTEWPASYWERPGLWFDDWPADLVLRVQSLDPSKGSDSKTGDYQAHIQIALGRDGTMYADAHLGHEQPPLMVARSIELARGFRPDVLVVEDNDALGLLVVEFERQLREANLASPVQSLRNTVNKVVRIRRLGAYFHRGQIRFRNTAGCRLLVDQLRDFAQATHDDGPDALELAVRRLEQLVHSP
jgi:predicted phage terminase large subunit-like protein